MKEMERILLESGTNEVEILEFMLDRQGFGVNVLKVQAIEQFDPSRVTEIPLAHPAVVGSYQYRNQVVTLVDLGKEMQIHNPNNGMFDAKDTAAIETILSTVPTVERPDSDLDAELDSTHCCEDRQEEVYRIVLVLEFNEQTTGFLVDGVNRIHRVNWNAISPLNPYLAAVQSSFTGSLNVEGREILLLDLERILANILPSSGKEFRAEPATDETLRRQRADIVLLLAEDSATIRNLLGVEFKRAGYEHLTAYDNGASCLQAIKEICETARDDGKDLRTMIGAIVSDIEMPQLDGLTLCRRVKSELGLVDVPVILFSSLINEQIAGKCEAVGADAYLSKPRFKELINIIDKYVLGS